MFTLTLWIFIAVLGLALYVYPALTVRRMYEGFAAEKLTPEMLRKNLALIDYFTDKTKGLDLAIPSIPPGQQKVIQTQMDALPGLKKQFQDFLASPATPRDTSDVNNAPFTAQGGMPLALFNALKAMTPPSKREAVLNGYNDILYSKETSGELPASQAQDPPDMATLLKKVEALMAPQIETPELDSVIAGTPAAKPKAKGLHAQPESVKEIRSEPGDVEEETTASGALEHGKSFQDKKPRRAPEEEEEDDEEESVTPSPKKRKQKIQKTQKRYKQQQQQQQLLLNHSHIPQDCPPAVQCPNMRDYIRKDSIPCWACKLK